MKGPFNALAQYSTIAGPPMKLTSEQRIERALGIATSIAGRWTKEGEVFIPAIEPGMVELDDAIKPVWYRKGYKAETQEEFSHYDFPDWPAERWSQFLVTSMRHRKLIFDRVGFNLLQGMPVPEHLRRIAGVHLLGDIKPISSPQKKRTQLHRDTLISGIARKVAESLDFPIGASKATFQKRSSAPLCGASFAAAGLYAWNVVISCQRANDVCFKGNLPVKEAQEAGVFVSGIMPVTNALLGVTCDHADRIETARAYLLRTS